MIGWMEDINWERVKTFADMDDPSDLDWLKETVLDLRKNLEEKIQNIQKALRDSDKESLSIICHQIKGVSSNFGLDKLHDLSVKAEKILKSEQWQESFPFFSEFESVWLDANNEIKRVLQI